MSSKKRSPAAVAAAAMAFGIGQAVHAKSPVPGKPGKQNIVEIATAVNAQRGELDYLLAAATCEYFVRETARSTSSTACWTRNGIACASLRRADGNARASPRSNGGLVFSDAGSAMVRH